MFVLETIRGPVHLVPEHVVGFRPASLTKHTDGCPASQGRLCQCRPEQVVGTEILVVGGNQQQLLAVEPPDVVVAAWRELLQQIANPHERPRLVVPVPVPRGRSLG